MGIGDGGRGSGLGSGWDGLDCGPGLLTIVCGNDDLFWTVNDDHAILDC